MKALLCMAVGFVLGVATLWGVQALSRTSPTASTMTTESPMPNNTEASMETTTTDISPLPETNSSVSAAPKSDSNQSAEDYPEVDLPHPVFGYFGNGLADFAKWDSKLAAEAIDYQWQAQLELTIRQALVTKTAFHGLEFKQLDCRQSACSLKLTFPGTDGGISERQINQVRELIAQPWMHIMAGSNTLCSNQSQCESVFYFPRDPSNDPYMETIPWRRRG